MRLLTTRRFEDHVPRGGVRALRVDARGRAMALRYDIMGKERSTPARMPVGQREVTVLSLV